MAPSGHYTGVEIMDGLSLEDEFEIRQTLATYCMGIDRKDRALIRQCFARDIKAHYIDLGKWNDEETLADYMIEEHAHYPATMHQVTTTLFAVHQGAVTAQTYVQANLLFAPPANKQGNAAPGEDETTIIKEKEDYI